MTDFNQTHHFAMVEGHRIAYLDEGAGPPLILLHGIPTSSLLWRKVIPVLAQTHRVIAPDMLNYGQSDKPERADVSIAAQARLLVGLMDALGLGRVDLAAHDIGGGVAQIVAVRCPERLNRLVLANAICFDSWPIPEFEPLQETGAETEISVDAFDKMLRDFLPQGVAVPDQLTGEAIDIMLQPWRGEDGKAALFRNFRRLDPEYTMAIARELEKLDLPTLVLWGDKDPFQKPDYAQRLADTIPGARLEWISGAAHWIMEEQPQAVADHIARFLDTPTSHRKA
ncbi:haloalkane dehalogenase [Roseovarius sp. A-2]|uniref:alpha/beta fold hydrolase n=1 Tax=Roseovarius sp. A-2 TaxID=1570360 RepID=UPI0009B5826B|nr:alpha/beta hydrolase [Roseovarius sp. A-2]GAW37361.1 haloalkane dehalogenase [Roseovarius sp. A-2]